MTSLSTPTAYLNRRLQELQIEVLKKLREFNLILKAEKCQFHQSETEFLYYNISQDGVSMDERKVDAIHNWSIPTILFFH